MKLDGPDRMAWARNMIALYAAMVYEHVHFAQATYGDGEWKNILGTGTGTNDQGEEYCHELGEALRETIRHPVGQWGALWPGNVGGDTHERAHEWIREHSGDMLWLEFRPLGWATYLGVVKPFLRAAKARRVVLVGPEHMKGLPANVLKPAVHVTVPERTAWRVVEETCEKVMDLWQPDDLVCFSSGQGSCLAIHRLWPELRDKVTLLDTGAMFDPYCGVYSRRVYRDPDWQENVMPRNVP